MDTDSNPGTSAIGDREAKFLDRLERKYEKGATTGRVRSYLIAAAVILVLFAASRWIPWWGVALLVAEVIGLWLFHQYKRFAAFKTHLLRKLWREVGASRKET